MSRPHLQVSRERQLGFSLIELMVTVVISLLAALAIFGVLSTYEGKKRTTTSVNDAVQSGNFGMFYLDKMVREAGSGFAQTWKTSYGCQIQGYNSAAVNTSIFPTTSTSALPADFSAVQTATGGKFVMAPVLIVSKGSSEAVGSWQSDALIIMAGNAGNAEYPTSFAAIPSSNNNLPLTNVMAFSSGDLIALIDASGSNQAACELSQVSPSFTLSQAANSGSALPTTTLPLATSSGTFYKASIGSATITNYSKSAVAIDLGNPNSDSPPIFDLVGVNANHVLVDYPMLSGSGVSNQVADGVYEMHAVYGIDGTGAGQITTWVSPATLTVQDLMSGIPGSSAAANSAVPGMLGTGAYALERIKAIRVGLILRTELPENTKTGATITPGPITLFSDLAAYGVSISRPLSATEVGYRYRTVEATIPVRNNILISQ